MPLHFANRALLFEFAEPRFQADVAPDSDLRSIRKWHLWCVVMARESPFRAFTYAANGMTASRDVTMDVADYLMLFI